MTGTFMPATCLTGNRSKRTRVDNTPINGNRQGLYIALLNIHGLIRGHNLELGRDADTGGQTKYVLELARALSRHPDVWRVDILTRQVIDAKLDHDYAVPEESIGHNAHIIRLPCGPRRYLRKENLWPYLDIFSDHILPHFRRVGRTPDVVHAHYADAGHVGQQLASLLDVPLVFTGHSLGRVKQQRLLEKGLSLKKIESQYAMTTRIEAEEATLDSADLVVTSTSQEIEEQYALYDNYHPKRSTVIAPGLDLSQFHPCGRMHHYGDIREQVEKFLHHPNKPMILALSRADERKNLATLVRAYAENERLREKANLVIIAGTRDDLLKLDDGARKVLSQLFYLIDLYDLHGLVSYPKNHEPNDVAEIYRLAAKTRGVFVNPALTEPFGLTLLEASASGLPIIATQDGGPRDIIQHCKNGVLIDPLDADQMGETILEALENKSQWNRWAKNGIQGTSRHYSWDGHVNKYLSQLQKIVARHKKSRISISSSEKLSTADRLLICDIDNTLLGDRTALDQLMQVLRENAGHIGFGIATGRAVDGVLKELQKWDVPVPDLLITSVGSEIYYGKPMQPDKNWRKHIDYRWSRERILKIMRKFKGLTLQPDSEQLDHKISFNVDPKKMPSLRDIRQELRKHDLHANPIYSHEAFLDLLPIRASKGRALRYIAMKWGIPMDMIMAAGDSGNDVCMLTGDTLGVVVGNHSVELRKLHGKPRIYFAEGHHAYGVLEGLQHFHFLEKKRDTA